MPNQKYNKETTSLLDAYYIIAKRIFVREDVVSPARLQRYLQIPYSVARAILDRMIDEQFCEPQNGAYPCKILRIDRVN